MHTYLDSLTKSCAAASDLAVTLAGMLDLDAQRTTDPSVASIATAASRVASAMAANASTACASVSSSLVQVCGERLGEVLKALPELTAMMKAREDLATDCDAYMRMVCARGRVPLPPFPSDWKAACVLD